MSEYICRYLNISDISEYIYRYIWTRCEEQEAGGYLIIDSPVKASTGCCAASTSRLTNSALAQRSTHCFHFHSNLALKPCSINCVKALHHHCTAAAFTTDLIPALHCWLPLVSAMLVAFHVFLTQCNRSRCVKAGLNVDEFLRPKGCLVALL